MVYRADKKTFTITLQCPTMRVAIIHENITKYRISRALNCMQIRDSNVEEASAYSRKIKQSASVTRLKHIYSELAFFMSTFKVMYSRETTKVSINSLLIHTSSTGKKLRPTYRLFSN